MKRKPTTCKCNSSAFVHCGRCGWPVKKPTEPTTDELVTKLRRRTGDLAMVSCAECWSISCVEFELERRTLRAALLAALKETER